MSRELSSSRTAAPDPASLVFIPSPAAIVPGTPALLTDYLTFDHVAVNDSVERSIELASATAGGRMRFATLDEHAIRTDRRSSRRPTCARANATFASVEAVDGMRNAERVGRR